MDQKINDELRLDLGRQVIVHEKNIIVDCVWCKFSKHHGRSFYQEADGKDWTTHPNYKGTLKLCPNCFGKGSIESDNTTIIDKVIIDVVQELELIEGVFGKIDRGKKLLTGQLSDIKGESNFNDNILFKAIKVVVRPNPRSSKIRPKMLKHRFLNITNCSKSDCHTILPQYYYLFHKIICYHQY